MGGTGAAATSSTAHGRQAVSKCKSGRTEATKASRVPRAVCSGLDSPLAPRILRHLAGVSVPRPRT